MTGESTFDSSKLLVSAEMLGQYPVQAARLVDSYPLAFRRVIYPDGKESFQCGYHWTQGCDDGIEWRDMPAVLVDARGRELDMQPDGSNG